MSKQPKEPRVFLEHILDSIEHIEKYTKNLTEKTFLEFAKEETQDAVVRRIEIIGEAIKNTPDELRKKYPDIPWVDIADMRNKLIHEYFGVDLELVWEVITHDLPVLKRQIRQVVDDMIVKITKT